MKKIFILLLTILLLAGCDSRPEPTETTQPPETTEATRPPRPTLVEQGIPWDDSGTLLRLPLPVTDLWKYTGTAAFQDDLLLWGVDNHRENNATISLCLVDLTDGSVLAETELGCDTYVSPQVLGDSIYLCDNVSGQILELDEALQIARQWQTEPNSSDWYMSGQETLYQYVDYERLTALDLTTGEPVPLPENWSDVIIAERTSSGLFLRHTDPDTLVQHHALLDLSDGTVRTPPFEEEFNTAFCTGDTWLCSLMRDINVYYLGSDDQPLRVKTQDSYLELLEDGSLLLSLYDNFSLKLYDPEGNFISGCRLSDSGDYYRTGSLIKSGDGSGYYFLMEDYLNSKSLMFWDTGKSTEGEPLGLAPIPPESEQMSLLREQAQELEQEYGVDILLGDQCQTEYMDFTADLTEDYEAISSELDELETALRGYPEGFFRQLRYYDVQGVRIHLVGALHPDEGSGREEGSYAAFTYPGETHFIVAADIFSSNTATYYHEFSHNIDLYLDYCATVPETTGYSEAQWQALNPSDFWYTHDYMSEFDILPDEYNAYFIDSYSTITPTEDRARVMEYAMDEYNDWIFDSHAPLREKLRYYCACIREAFDTTGWPETTLWEQYLTEE